MIPFFRKIRKKMSDDNKPIKYLRYAIGEILLVMIGILLALQVNTWNQERQLKAKEIKSLIELKANLVKNISEFENFLTKESGLIKNISTLINYQESNVKFHDSLNKYFVGIIWLEQINLSTSTYETMKTNGLDLISSDSLRLNITELHEIQYSKFIDVIKDVSLAYFNRAATTIYNKYFENIELYQSREFKYYLKSRVIWKNSGIRICMQRKEETDQIIKQIDTELEKLNK